MCLPDCAGWDAKDITNRDTAALVAEHAETGADGNPCRDACWLLLWSLCQMQGWLHLVMWVQALGDGWDLLTIPAATRRPCQLDSSRPAGIL